MSQSQSQMVWLVTGASTGIGLALVRRILARGDRVIATARSIDKLDTALADVEAADRERLRTLKLDVLAGFEELQKVAASAIALWGSVDVLVNNAGLLDSIGGTEELGAGHFAKLIATNLYGVIDVTNSFLPHMRERRCGTIIVIGSRSAIRNEFFGSGPYSATKAAVHSYAETLAAEVLPFNIRVTIAAPGTMKSSFNDPPLAPGKYTDYDPHRQALQHFAVTLRDRPDADKGDPLKAMDIIIDLVHGEGRAKGKEGWPLWLLLGGDALADWKIRANKMLKAAEEWGDLATGLTHD